LAGDNRRMIPRILECLGHKCCNCGQVYRVYAPMHYIVCDMRFIQVCQRCRLKTFTIERGDESDTPIKKEIKHVSN
jgi:hypothetical protein